MATRLFSTYAGDHDPDVTETVGSATVAGNVEVTVDLSVTLVGSGSSTRQISREEVLLALERISRKIMIDVWPPA